MTVYRPWCQAHLIFQIKGLGANRSYRWTHCARPLFALYSVAMETSKPPSQPDSDDVVTRRSFGGKLLYVPPTVLAVIKATERPALAQSAVII
jgi:hypothetical protein